MWLLLGIVLLSVADLTLTLTYLTSVGLVEGNPIAAWLIHTTRSPWALALYKTFTVAICVSLLYRMRQRREGELAAWCSVLILVALSIWWNRYALYQPDLPGLDRIVMAQPQNERPSHGARRDGYRPFKGKGKGKMRSSRTKVA